MLNGKSAFHDELLQSLVEGSADASQRVETRPGAGARAERLVQEMASAEAELHQAVGMVRDRLLQVVLEEMRRMTTDALAVAQGAVSEPVRSAAPERDVPAARGRAPAPADEAHLSPVPDDSGRALRTEAGKSAGRQAASRPPMMRQADSAPMMGAVAIKERVEMEAEGPLLGAEEQERPISVPSHDAAPSPEAVPGKDCDDVFEGTVRLAVEARECPRQVVHFVNQVCQKPQLRLLRLVGKQRKNGVEMWLGLREPLALSALLHQMEGVQRVDALPAAGDLGQERLLNVWLQ